MVRRFIESLVALALVPLIAYAADDGAKKPTQFQKFAKYIPFNQPIDKIEIPQYDKQGVQIALMRADVAWRIGEGNLRMEMLEIQVFEEGVLAMTLTTPRARYDIDRRLLRSDAPTKMVRHGKPALTTQGRGLIFDLDSQVGSFLEGTTTRLSVSRSRSKSNPKPLKQP